MPMKGRTLLTAAAILVASAGAAMAAQSSLGIGTNEVAMQPTGVFAGLFHWINAQQQEFYRAMTGALGAQDLPSYAYPYGASSPRTKARMARRFATARGIRSGVNSGTIDLAQLKSIPLEARRWRPDEIDAAIDQAVATRGWVIFFTHDVSQSPSPFGCTPAMLEHALERLARARIEVLPVKHAMARVVFGSHA